MPIYVYEHPETGERKEVIQSMKETHEYSEGGVKWKRVFVNPNSAIDTKIDPDSSRAFIKKKDNKGMTLGDMFDLSKKLSQEREKKYGKDPVKEKTAAEYKRKTTKEHPLASR